MRSGVIALSLVVSAVVRAQAPSAEVVVIESLVERAATSADVDQLAGVLNEPRALAGGALAARIVERLGVRPLRLDPSQLAELLGRFARAEEALFYRGAAARAALPEIEQLRERIRAAVATRAHNPSARQMHRSALLALGRAYAQQPSDPRLLPLFAELATHFPDQPIDAQKDGLRLAQLYGEYVVKLRHGTIEIVARGKGTVFLNGRPIGAERVTLPEGRYELFAAGPGGDGRLRVVELAAGQTRKVVLATELDLALDTDDGVALRFGDAATQKRSDRELGEELRQLLGSRQLYVLRRRDREPSLLIRLREDGVAERTIPIGADRQAVLAIAQELVAAPVSGGKIETTVDLATRPNETRPPESQRAVRLGSYAVFGVAAALLAAGLVADALDGVGTCLSSDSLCPNTYRTRPLGPALAGVGAGLAIASATTLLASDRLDAKRMRPLRTLGIVLLGAGAPAIVGGAVSLRVASTREPDAEGGTRALDRKRGSGIAAVTVGAGLVLAGVGVVVADLLGRQVVPTVAVGREGIGVGAAGRF